MIKEKIKEEIFEATCDFCGTTYEYSENDIHSVYGGRGFTCPKCGNDIIVNKVPPFSYPLGFWRTYSDKEGVYHIPDDRVQKYVNSIKEELLSSSNSYDYSCISTGDVYVFGTKNEDNEITIVVARDFYEDTRNMEDLK